MVIIQADDDDDDDVVASPEGADGNDNTKHTKQQQTQQHHKSRNQSRRCGSHGSSDSRLAINAAAEIAYLLSHCEEGDAETIISTLERDGKVNFSRASGTPANSH